MSDVDELGELEARLRGLLARYGAVREKGEAWDERDEEMLRHARKLHGMLVTGLKGVNQMDADARQAQKDAEKRREERETARFVRYWLVTRALGCLCFVVATFVVGGLLWSGGGLAFLLFVMFVCLCGYFLVDWIFSVE